jgi:predicted ABC-class ATPase
LIAFIADGSNLARQSGIDDRPLVNAVSCFSPKSLAVELKLRDGSLVRGLGIPQGMCLIVGAGKLTDAVQALKIGAFDYLTKPVKDTEIVRHVINRALKNAQLERESKLFHEKLEQEVRERTGELR